MLTSAAQCTEYINLVVQAAQEEDPVKRIALLSLFMLGSISFCETVLSKPFNPILGETFEWRTDLFEMITEQVSHHPPVSACHVRGKDFYFFTNLRPNVFFNGKYLTVTQQYRHYFHMTKFDEVYEII